ncbi:MAG: glucan biosynthesis protein, partial [Halocynthiibacter sp.]
MAEENMTAMHRRGFLTVAGGALLSASGAGLGAGARAADRGVALAFGARAPFSPEDLFARARAMASRKFQPRAEIPAAWQALPYELYKSIWFKSEAALWHGSDRPLNVDFFAPGLYYPRPVAIFAVEDGAARRVRFDVSLFTKTDKVPELPIDDTLGFSGFRLRAEREAAKIFEEFMVFQG